MDIETFDGTIVVVDELFPVIIVDGHGNVADIVIDGDFAQWSSGEECGRILRSLVDKAAQVIFEPVITGS